jgi:hypothetical protein
VINGYCNLAFCQISASNGDLRSDSVFFIHSNRPDLNRGSTEKN